MSNIADDQRGRTNLTAYDNRDDDWVLFLEAKMVHNIRNNRNYYQLALIHGDMGSKWSRRFGLMSSFIFVGFAPD